MHEGRFSDVAKTRVEALLRRMHSFASSGLRFAFSVPILRFDPYFTDDFHFLLVFLTPAAWTSKNVPNLPKIYPAAKKTPATLLAGCTKTRLTRLFSQEKRSRPKVFVEKLLPPEKIHAKTAFPAVKTAFRRGVPEIAVWADAGASHYFCHFSVGVLFLFCLSNLNALS